PAHIGQCCSFDLKTYVYNGRKKTYMYISGCPKELGCKIVFGVADNDVLVKVKRITEFMVYVVYNLKLETCLMRDEFAQIPAPSDDVKKPGQAGEKHHRLKQAIQANDTAGGDERASRSEAINVPRDGASGDLGAVA